MTLFGFGLLPRVQALGSQGGEGVTRASDMRKTRGASVTAKFMLNEGDHLLFLVGQLGDSACEVSQITLPSSVVIIYIQRPFFVYMELIKKTYIVLRSIVFM